MLLEEHKPRCPMTADTDPTDEELETVMREVRELVIQRQAISDAWLQE